jgi:hypothetical protein
MDNLFNQLLIIKMDLNTVFFVGILYLVHFFAKEIKSYSKKIFDKFQKKYPVGFFIRKD